MYILKNAIKNLKRNKSRNIMITAIIFVIVLTSVISMVISNTSSGVIDDYKNKFGAEIFLTPNFEKIREESTGKEGEMTMLAMPELTSEQYLKFAVSDYLKGSIIQGFTSAGSNTVNAIDKSESDLSKDDSLSGILGKTLKTELKL